MLLGVISKQIIEKADMRLLITLYSNLLISSAKSNNQFVKKI